MFAIQTTFHEGEQFFERSPILADHSLVAFRKRRFEAIEHFAQPLPFGKRKLFVKPSGTPQQEPIDALFARVRFELLHRRDGIIDFLLTETLGMLGDDVGKLAARFHNRGFDFQYAVQVVREAQIDLLPGRTAGCHRC